MTSEQARDIFNKVAATHRANGDHDKAATAELCREYFTNPTFRKALENHVWAIVTKRKP